MPPLTPKRTEKHWLVLVLFWTVNIIMQFRSEYKHKIDIVRSGKEHKTVRVREDSLQQDKDPQTELNPDRALQKEENKDARLPPHSSTIQDLYGRPFTRLSPICMRVECVTDFCCIL